MLYLFPRVILYNCFLFLGGQLAICRGSWVVMYAHGFRFWVLGLRIGFWGWGFQLMEVWAYGVGLLGFLGWGTLYKHKRLTLQKKGAVRIGKTMSYEWFGISNNCIKRVVLSVLMT